MCTSPDDFTRTPQIASNYKVDQEIVRGMPILHAPLLTAEYQLEQNELDPPDMEFYNGSPFEYEGRCFIGVSNYAGSSTEPAARWATSCGPATTASPEAASTSTAATASTAFTTGC